MAIRVLDRHEPHPTTAPRRYVDGRGYIRLRWKVGPDEYVEQYEHRVVMGLPPSHLHVHHVNGDKADNRPENLELMTVEDHAKLHGTDPYTGKRRAPVIRRSRKRNGKRRRRKFPRIEADRLYRQGMSTVEIGELYGVDPSNVSRGLREWGTKMRPCGNTTEARDEDILLLYRGCVGVTTIAQELGCSHPTIYDCLDRHGVRRRGPGRQTSEQERIRDETLAAFRSVRNR